MIKETKQLIDNSTCGKREISLYPFHFHWGWLKTQPKRLKF